MSPPPSASRRLFGFLGWRARRCRTRKPNRVRLMLEQLEDRRLLSALLGGSSNLVTNGGFELLDSTGNAQDWTFTPAASGSDFFVGSTPDFGPHTGNEAANFGSVSTNFDSISQTLATVPGASYTLSYWLSHDSSNQANEFQASWGGNVVQDLLNANYFGWTQYSFTVTATSSSTALTFSGYEIPAWYGLDDVSVTSNNPVTLSAFSATEGQTPQNVQVATYYAPGASLSSLSASVSWGDGDTSSTSSGNVTIQQDSNNANLFDIIATKPNVYAEEGTQTLSVTVTQDSTNNTNNGYLTVADAPLTAGQLTPPTAIAGIAFSQTQLFHFTDTDPAANLSDYSAVITWGDGNSDTVTSTASTAGQIVADPNGGFDVLGSHTYSQALSNATFSVQVIDNGDGRTTTDPSDQTTSGSTSSFNVAADTPPTVNPLTITPGTGIYPATDGSANVTITTGTSLAATGSFTDPDPGDSWTAQVNYGDGTATNPDIQTLTLNADKTFSVPAHQYTTAGTYTLTVTVTDAAGLSGTATETVLVDTPPVVNSTTITASTQVKPDTTDNGATVQAGATVTGSVTFTDPDPGDSWTVTVANGDPNGTQTFVLNTGSTGGTTISSSTITTGTTPPPSVSATDVNGLVTFSFSSPPPANIDASVGGFYNLTITVTDAAGLSGSSTSAIKVLTQQQFQSAGQSIVTNDTNGAPVTLQASPTSSVTVTGAVGTINVTSYNSKPINDGSPPGQVSVALAGGGSTTYDPQNFYDISGANLKSTSLTIAFKATFTTNPGNNFAILFWDPTANGGQGGWVQVLDDHGQPPPVTITQNADGTFTVTATVTLDSGSTPRLADLTGTVFAVAVPAPPPPPPDPPAASTIAQVASVSSTTSDTISTTVQVSQPLAFVPSSGTASDAGSGFNQTLTLSSNASSTLVLRVSPEVQFAASHSAVAAAAAVGEGDETVAMDDLNALFDWLFGNDNSQPARRVRQNGAQGQPVQPGLQGTPVQQRQAPRPPAASRLQLEQPPGQEAEAVETIFTSGVWVEAFLLDDPTPDSADGMEWAISPAPTSPDPFGATAAVGILFGAAYNPQRTRRAGLRQRPEFSGR
jgi:hypothetical protein